MMRLQWTQDLDIETLEARVHWVTMGESSDALRNHLKDLQIDSSSSEQQDFILNLTR